MSEGSLSPEKFAEDIADAADRFDVVQSTATTLLLDLDTPEALVQFDRVLPKLAENFGPIQIDEWKSKSGNTHAKITLSSEFPIAIRLALQAALGSDGIREVLAVKRMLNGCVEPSVLFKPKEPT